MRNLPMPIRHAPSHGDVTGCLVAASIHAACAIALFWTAPHATWLRVPAFTLTVTAAMLLAQAGVNERRIRQQSRPVGSRRA